MSIRDPYQIATEGYGNPDPAPAARKVTDAPISGGHGSALSDARAQGSSDQRGPDAPLCPQNADHPGSNRFNPDTGQETVAPGGRGR
jgi:hypothetical protein